MSLFGDFAFGGFIANLFAVFLFVLWLWLVIATARDLLRRRDISGGGTALWVILFVAVPSVGIFAYLLAEGHGIAERDEAQARRVRDELISIVGFGVADELVKLERLRAQNAISQHEYLTLKGRLTA